MLFASLLSVALFTFQGDTTAVRPLRQLIHTTWSPKEGAPAGVIDLAQTPDGYIWIGTNVGLVRFDGVRFLRYAPLSGDSLPSETIRAMLVSRDSSLWVVRKAGVVSRLRNHHLVSYDSSAGLVETVQLAESSEGMLVAATGKGLFRLLDGKWENAGAGWGFPDQGCLSVWFDRDDTLWAASDDRLVYLPSGAKRFIDSGMHIRKPVPGKIRMLQERDGTIWLSELGHAISIVRPAPGMTPGETRLNVAPFVSVLDRSGNLWIGSRGDGVLRVPQLQRLHGRVLEHNAPDIESLSLKHGLLSDLPTSMIEDHEGSIWVGSGSGVERFREGAFASRAGLSPGRPRYVQPTRDASAWSAAYGDSAIQRFTARGQETFTLGFPTYAVAQDTAGRLMVAPASSATSQAALSPSPFVPIANMDSGPSRSIRTTASGSTV